MIEVDLPDGGVAEFPDGTPKETITAALRKRFGGAQSVNRDAKGDSEDTPGAGISGIGGLFQGLTFGFGDEALGTVKAIEMGLRGDERPFADRYAEGVQAFRDLNNRFADAAPVSNTAGELAGAVASSIALPIGRVAQGASHGAKALAGAKAGSAGGALFGAGTADGDIVDRGIGAVEGGVTGAVLGAALPGVIDAGSAVVKGITTPIRRRLTANPQHEAATLASNALVRDLGSVDRAAGRLDRAQSVAPDTVMADVAGKNTRNLLRAASNVPSAGRERLVRNLEGRQAKQAASLQDAIADSVGDGKRFFDTVDGLIATRKAKARPLFERAYNTPTPYTRELQDVLERPTMQRLIRSAGRDAADRGTAFQQFFIEVGEDGIQIQRKPDTRALHFIKMHIDSLIDATRKGQETSVKNTNFSTLLQLKRDLQGAIDNPAYKTALREFAGDKALEDAVTRGREAFAKLQPEEIARELKALPKSEQDLYRLGVARSIFEILERGNIGRNRVEVLRSPGVMSRLKRIFPDKKARNRFIKALIIHSKQSQTRNAVQGNSTTAAQLAEGIEAGVDPELVAEGISAAGSVARGDILGALLNTSVRARNIVTGITPRVAEELIDILASPDAPAVQKQIADAIMRKLSAEQRAAITEIALSRIVGGQAGALTGPQPVAQ